MENHAQEQAFISPDAIVGENCTFGLGTVVEEGAQIGDNCTIGAKCFISNGAIIGNHVTISDNVTVPRGVCMQDNVFCGSGTTFANTTSPQYSSDYQTAPNQTHIERGAKIQPNVTLMNGITIGASALITSGSLVMRSVLAHAMMVGAPARQWAWVCECGRPLTGVSLKCACSNHYMLVGTNPPVLSKI